MNEKLNTVVDGAQVVFVLCNQWGDSGKGKIVDALAPWADVIARGTGGRNAGHTVYLKGEKFIFHLIPVGVLYDQEKKITVMGNGMAIDIEELCKELDILEAHKLSYNNLMVSKDAHVTMPYHIVRDQIKNQSQQNGSIGSTGRGIGPTYTDKAARTGILIEDLYDLDTLTRKIKKAKEEYGGSRAEDVVEYLKPFADRLKPLVRNTIHEMHVFFRQGKKILGEGSQGLLLGQEFGTYPNITSCDCSINGTASGMGISARVVDKCLGLFKFPFMTRVGAGTFPTEFGGKGSEHYCAREDINLERELEMYQVPYEKVDNEIKYNPRHIRIMQMVRSNDLLIKGTGIRLAAGEYGATTGRPRRTGWTDAVAARYAVNVNGPYAVLTKVDTLMHAEYFRICYGYRMGRSDSEESSDSMRGRKDQVDYFDRSDSFLRAADPIYKEYAGYGDIAGISEFADLPHSLLEAIKDFEKFTGCEVVLVSNGPKTEELIVV